MDRTQAKAGGLQFIFTEKDFYPDIRAAECTKENQEWQKNFERDRYYTLYRMGFEEREKDLTATGSYLYLLSNTFLKMLTSLPELELAREQIKVEPTEEQVDSLQQAVPFAIGAEYITEKWIRNIFRKLTELFAKEIASYEGTVELYLTEKSQHLHVPLKYALTEYKNERDKLLALLSCLNRAAEVSGLIAGFMERGEMFHPLRLTAEEAYTFLKDIERIEETGILCRIPNWWKKKLAMVSMSVSLGEEKPSMLGFDTLVSVQPKLMVDGMELSKEEIIQLLAQTEGLALLKGKWIEVDHKRLHELLAQMEKVPGEMTLLDAMQMELGKPEGKADVGPIITNGKWLSGLLGNLRKPDNIRKAALPKSFRATLRPYQKSGFT